MHRVLRLAAGYASDLGFKARLGNAAQPLNGRDGIAKIRKCVFLAAGWPNKSNRILKEIKLLTVLANRTYRHLFLAQVIALIGTGLATVALGLLAYNLAGAQAGSVLGTALAIKMVAYVVVAPIVGAFADRLP